MVDNIFFLWYDFGAIIETFLSFKGVGRASEMVYRNASKEDTILWIEGRHLRADGAIVHKKESAR